MNVILCKRPFSLLTVVIGRDYSRGTGVNTEIQS